MLESHIHLIIHISILKQVCILDSISDQYLGEPEDNGDENIDNRSSSTAGDSGNDDLMHNITQKG